MRSKVFLFLVRVLTTTVRTYGGRVIIIETHGFENESHNFMTDHSVRSTVSMYGSCYNELFSIKRHSLFFKWIMQMMLTKKEIANEHINHSSIE